MILNGRNNDFVELEDFNSYLLSVKYAARFSIVLKSMIFCEKIVKTRFLPKICPYVQINVFTVVIFLLNESNN